MRSCSRVSPTSAPEIPQGQSVPDGNGCGSLSLTRGAKSTTHNNSKKSIWEWPTPLKANQKTSQYEHKSITPPLTKTENIAAGKSVKNTINDLRTPAEQNRNCIASFTGTIWQLCCECQLMLQLLWSEIEY